MLRAFAPALKSAWIAVIPRGVSAPAFSDGDAGTVLSTALLNSALITLDPASEDRASRAATALTLLSALRVLADAVQAGGAKNIGPTIELSTSLLAAARGFTVAHDANIAALCK